MCSLCLRALALNPLIPSSVRFGPLQNPDALRSTRFSAGTHPTPSAGRYHHPLLALASLVLENFTSTTLPAPPCPCVSSASALELTSCGPALSHPLGCRHPALLQHQTHLDRANRKSARKPAEFCRLQLLSARASQTTAPAYSDDEIAGIED
ncbi:uncharacterized protein BDZ99DRAFT_166847 [Mytilinidion resinicola]|uniref:Uncharacterized protein n=1 Tax=Mytilinidion resinicola TaxID=574789 RepID=A0A6A6Y4W2_9PEZI|nr:uncharacterized protein BDZ99DRAFT_166847 [Mytilinidion resinicola]KAF2803558.1 hypothetical protein BDZ99DRAFT_166847 [Mytilinidion resinicola]